MGIKTTEQVQKFHECFYVIVRKNVREFLSLEANDLVEINWLRRVRKKEV